VSKQFTAACVFLLRDDGALSLDSPLADYLPDYRHARKMTLRQVLTMSSGVPIDIEVCEAPINGRLDGTTLVENLNRLELEFTPGEHFAYSNCAYDLAGAVVAKVSGMPFERFIDGRIFKPLGMTSSYVLGTRKDGDFAEGYSAEGKSWKPAPLSAADRAFASGNLASNPGEMQRWNRALLNAELLSRKSMREMFELPVLTSGARTNYASGWFVEPNGPIWHGGTLEGYGTVNMLVPAIGHAITILGNTVPGGRWKPWEVAREIYNEISLGPALPAFSPRVLTTAVPK
jgi:CubicO group peptidase (beta-lactamase class C family)